MKRDILLRTTDGELKARLSERLLGALVASGAVIETGRSTGRITFRITYDLVVGDTVTVNGREVTGVEPSFTLNLWTTDYITVIDKELRP